MGAETIVELYRTKEFNGTFSIAVTISFFNNVATIQGLSGTVQPSDIKEILGYLKERGCTHAVYVRKSVVKSIDLSRVNYVENCQ